MTPPISIIMPTYNRGGSLLNQAIDSVIKQTFTDFEFIIIDDASTDNTEETVSLFKDARIKYFKTDHNHGEYWATNFAANKAQGKYLTWIHSDDIMPENSLEIRYHYMQENSDIDFVHGDINKIDIDGNQIEYLIATDWPKEKILSQYLLLPEQREIKYLIHHLTIMMKWDFFYKAGPFDASLPFAGDIDWLIRAVRVGHFNRIPKILYNYRTHPGTRRVQDVKQGVDKNEVTLMINRRYAQV